MKKNYLKSLVIAVMLLLSSTLKAQDMTVPTELAINTPDYKLAVGLRAGETSGLTIKQIIGNSKALEGIVGVWYQGMSFTLLFEKYEPAFEVSGLNWYYGAGAHAAIDMNYTFRNYWGDRYYHYHSGGVGLGVDGIIGLEYKIPPIPIAISIDVKPFLEVNTLGGAWLSLDPGLGIKITF